MSLDLVTIMRRHAVASLVIDQAGALVEPIHIHPLGIKAPLKLVAFMGRVASSDHPLAEIGIGNGHPYRSNHKIHNLPPREYRPGLSIEQIRGVFARFMELLDKLAWQGLEKKPWLPEKQKERFNYGLTISIADRDRNLQRLLEELERLSTILEWRLHHLAHQIRKHRLVPMQNGYPQSWHEELAPWFRDPSRARGYLRPFVLSDLAWRLQSQETQYQRGTAFLEFLAETGIIPPHDYHLAVSGLTQRLQGTFRLSESFIVLPARSAHWDVQEDVHGLPVTCERRVNDGWSYLVRLKNPRWRELRGVKSPDPEILKAKREKQRRVKGRRAEVEEEIPATAVYRSSGSTEAPDWVVNSITEGIDEPGVNG